MTSYDKARLDGGLYLFIIIASGLISLWSVYADPIINIDGILYIKSAIAITQGDFDAALAQHKWPFYPFLISLVHQLSGLDIELSAHVLNYFLNILTCIAFAFLVKELGGGAKVVLVAAVLIVFFPGLNELRTYIIRDHGYIAFYLWSLYFLIRALHIRSKPVLAMSLMSMFVAVLFRIEGLVFLIAMPIIYLNSRDHALPMKKLSFNFIILATVLILISVFGWWLYSPGEQSNYSFYSIENINKGWIQGIEYLDNKIEVLKRQVLNSSSDTTGRLVFLWTVSGIIFSQVLIILSIPNAALVAYSFINHLVFPNKHGIKPWKLFILFNLIILAVFTLTKFFLTDRYPLALAVTLLAAAPIAISSICARWKAKPRNSFKSNIGYILIVLLLVANSYEGLTSFTKKRYLKEAGQWIENNVDQQATLYTNNHLIGFYSQKHEPYLIVEPDIVQLIGSFYRGEWIHVDYLALEIWSDPEFQDHLKKTLWVKPEKTLINERDREIRIYNIKKYRERENQ